MMRAFFRLGAGLSLGVLAVSAAPASAEPPETLVLAAPWHVMSLDPSVSGDAFQRLQVAETLVDADETGALRPGLATAWEALEDGTGWRFALREGVRFHDGSPFDAEAAAAALSRAAARPGVLDKAPLASIRAEGGAVVVETNESFAALPALLAHASTVIFAPASFDAAGEPLDAIGTGPYRMTALIPPQTMELERFDGYWGDAPFFAKARFLSASRAETRALLAESGDAHLVHNLDPAGFARLKSVDGVALEAKPIPRVTLLKANLEHPFLSDPRARRALSLAIDRAGIAAGILRFPGSEATQLFPPVISGWHDPELAPLRHDPEEARRLLAELGWSPGSDGVLERDGERFSLTLRTYPDRAELPLIAAALQDQFRRIGVALEVSVSNFSEIPAGHQDGSLELALYARNYALSTDPIGAVRLDFADGGGDWGAMRWSRPEVDAATRAIAATADTEARAPHIRTLTEALQADLPVIPILWYQHTLAHDEALRNVTLDPFERSYGLGALRWAD